MQNLENCMAEDDKAIEVLLKGIKGEGKRQRQQGTFLTYIAAMQNDNESSKLYLALHLCVLINFADPVKLPQQSNLVNLRTAKLYGLVI